MNTKRLAASLCAAVMTLTIASSAQADPAQTLVVPAGTVYAVTAPLNFQTVEIAGTLLMSVPGNLVVNAADIHVASTGQILGWDGRPGVASLYAPTILSTAGQAGGDVILTASNTLRLDNNSLIRAGSGGAGGNLATHLARGTASDGGSGGSVILTASQMSGKPIVLPGAGGDGGNVCVTPPAGFQSFAEAGNGGRAGSIQTTALASPQADAFAMTFTKVTAPLSSRAIIVDDGVHPFCVSPGGINPPTDLKDATSCGTTPPTGADGQDKTIGDGGDGGDACSIAAGAKANPDPGYTGTNPAFHDCTDGGPGGIGGSAVSSGKAGKGGDAVIGNGGKGGDLTSVATGANGGAGGEAAEHWITGGYCSKGGDGGKGGDATAKGNAGDGGNAVCGKAGDGGVADTSGTQAGSGGSGGQGSPDGGNGSAGATEASATSGTGGTGVGVCPPIHFA